MNFNEKRILGMIHLSGDNSIKIERALEEILIYEEEGLYGCIIENYHGSVDDVENVLKAISNRENKIKIGINILPNEYDKAFDLADKYKIDFIQLDYISGQYERTKPFDVGHFLYFSNKNPLIHILGGVWPKYYNPISGSELINDILDACDLANAIVVTGHGTGKETSLDKIKIFKSILHDHPLIIGAGLDSTNVVEQMKFANGAIVGSCFKPYKRTHEKVSRELVKEFMSKL